MESRRVTRYLRIAVTALCLTACVLLVALWVRSYWTLDLCIGCMSRTAVIHGTSSNGQMSLGMFSSPAGFNWTWKSAKHTQLDAKSHLQLQQLEKEYRTILKSLEDQRSLALRRQSNDNAKLTYEIDQLTVQIDQVNVEYQVASGRLMQGIASRLWGNPTFEAQLLSEAALGFPSISTFGPFGAKRGTNGWTVVCPHWCAVGLIGAFAIAIGMGSRWRFSLRTLLIATTLVAVGLGIVVYLSG